MKCCFASPEQEITVANQDVFLGHWLPVLVGPCGSGLVFEAEGGWEA